MGRRRPARWRRAADGLRGRLMPDGHLRTVLLTVTVALVAVVPPLVAAMPELNRLERPQAQIAALTSYAVALLLAAWPGPRRLDELTTVAAVLAFTMCVALTYQSEPTSSSLLSVRWYFQGLNVLLAMLVVRHRSGWAWGMAWIALALAATDGARSGQGMIMGMLAMANAFGVLVVTHLLVTEIERLLERRWEARALGASARSDDDAEQDTVNASIRRVQDVRQLSGTLLERIADDPSPVDQSEITRFRLVEAQLRDSIRGRSITTPALLEATRSARERGVKVDILDERGKALPDHILAILSEHGGAVLDAAHAGSVTIRAFSEDDPTAVLIVHDPGTDDDEPVALEIAQGTGEVSEF